MSVTATSLPPNYTLPGRITDAAPELKRYSGPYNLARPLPDGEARISLYGYWPGSLLAYVALVTFSLALVLHLFWMVRHKTTRVFQGLLALGCVMELLGYSFRLKNTANPFVVNWFVINFFLIITAPVAFAAALYLALSIAVRTMKIPSILPMGPKKVVALFVFIDVATTVTQCVGSGLIGIATSQKAKQQTPIIPVESANALLLTGLAVQCAGFIAFLAVVAITYIRNRRLRLAPPSQETLPVDDKDSAVIVPSEPESVRPIPGRFWVVLLLSSMAIWLRTLYRMGETTEGVFGYASSHEPLFATLEFTPVIVSVLLWALFPLERLLR